jgi:hypothetical protein
VKKLLSQEETMVPALFSNLRKALMPFMDESIYSKIEIVCSMIEERSKSSCFGQDQTSAAGTSSDQKSCKISSGEKTTAAVAMETQGEEEGEETKRKESLTCGDGYCLPCATS